MTDNSIHTSPLQAELAKAWCRTQAKEIKIRYEWTIDHFSLTYKNMGDKYRSSTFYANNYDQLKWYLDLRPNGFDADTKDYVSLFLILTSSDKLEANVSYKLSLLNDKIKETNVFKDTHIFKTNKGVGWSKFINRNFLLDSSNGLLPENKLTILCEISFVTDIINVSSQPSSRPIKVLDSTFGNDFGKLLESANFYDVTLVACNHEFKAHKAILAARSDVFAAMFEYDLAETRSNRVVITDIDHEVLNEMLRFIYTEKAPNIDKMAQDLLVAADKYALENLKLMCEEALIANLSIETAMETLIIADRHGADRLKAATKYFIHTHVKDVMETQGWKEVAKTKH